MRTHFLGLIVLLGACGGGGSENKTCDPSKTGQCNTGFSCEPVAGGEPACFPDTIITGKVFDATMPTKVLPGARVIAIDGSTNAAASNVAITDATGVYKVAVHLPRAADATADAANKTKDYTLRVSAKGYLDFPSPIRQAIPIHVMRFENDKVLRVNMRDVALLPLMGAATTLGSLGGTVRDGTLPVPGVLVVAEGGGKAFSTVSDAAGAFVILNVPAASYDVHGYIAGKDFTPLTGVALAASQDKTDLALVTRTPAMLSKLTGSIDIVNGQTTTTETLIVLATAATREVPAGLAKMTAGHNYEIDGVPPGSYLILASFNNDDLVRDPDPQQLPRPILVNLPADAPGGTLAVGTFKITGDVGIVAPGTGAPDEAPVPAAGLTLRWMDDSGEDFYGISMTDAYGVRIWGSAPSTTVEPTVKADKNATSIAYTGPALTPGQTYWWRVDSYKCLNNQTPCTLMKEISTSEDLRGVFDVAVP
jgi:hypothetical protein